MVALALKQCVGSGGVCFGLVYSAFMSIGQFFLEVAAALRAQNRWQYATMTVRCNDLLDVSC